MYTERYASEVFRMALKLMTEGQVEEGLDMFFDVSKHAKELAERSITRVDLDYGYSTIYYKFGKSVQESGAVLPSITAFALAKRLHRHVYVTFNRVRGKAIYLSVVREFAYLPAFQYMYDDRLQMPKVWEKVILPEDMAEESIEESLRGVAYRIANVYEVVFYPIRVGGFLKQSDVSTRYLRSIYSYLQKARESRISKLMEEAFGSEVSVSYEVREVREIAERTSSSVTLYLTVPRIRAGRIIPALNLLIQVRMLNGAEIHFVDKVVTTFPVMFMDAKKYLPNPPSAHVVISPTTLSILLTELRR